MNQNIHFRILFASFLDLLDTEAGMHTAVALPENHPGVLQLLRSITTERLHRIPDHHLVVADALLDGGVATKMLIREEHDAFAALEGPIVYPCGVR